MSLRVMFLVAAGLGGWSSSSRADTVVTTYVTKVQEERQSTRWTLTEWLRIKERMKMMDVWLAMFSDPKKDTFRPELNLSYAVTRGAADAGGSVNGKQGRGQLWLTNLVSSTVGIRMLNIDLGLEGFHRDATWDDSVAGEAASLTAPGPSAVAGHFGHSYYTGKSIQDSSIILKYGEFRATAPLVSDDTTAADLVGAAKAARGKVAGAELQLYLFKWLGAEGTYTSFTGRRPGGDVPVASGTYIDYLGFVEISLLRLMVGRYEEEWQFDNSAGKATTKEHGVLGGVKLLL